MAPLEAIDSQEGSMMPLTGFTIVEMLVALTIFSVISLTVYATFNSGMNIWSRAQKTNLQEKRVLIKAEKLSRQLRETFVFKEKEIVFSGEKQRINFPAIIDSEVANLTYLFDPAKKILLTGTDLLPEILAARKDNGAADTKFTTYLEGVENVSFAYFYFDTQKSVYLWRDNWKDVILPVAVKLEITLKDETYSTTIFIPCA